MRVCLLAVLSFLSAGPAIAGGLPAAQFQELAGEWHCGGTFANGKALSSNLHFDWDAAAAVMVKRHDDVQVPGYHAVELWAATKAGGLQDTIADPFGGVREFTSPGWSGDVLTWTGVVTTPYFERFVYTRLDPATLRVDWDVSKDGAAYKNGDTLTCKKT
jgi:hypothetical protein